jgi:hypothetical protein
MPSVTIWPGTAGIKTARMLKAISRTKKIIDFFIVCSLKGYFCTGCVNNVTKFLTIRVKNEPLLKKN